MDVEEVLLTLANARIFDGRKVQSGSHSVTLANGLIVAVDAPPEEGEVVDLAGMTLMPGLISCHFHSDFFKFTLEQGMAGEPLGTEFPPGVLMAIGVRNCQVLLDSGFTGYVGAACSNDIDAQLKIAIAEGIIKGPRIRACSPHVGTTADLNDSKKWWRRPYVQGTDVFVDGPDAMRKAAREYIRRGAETIKFFASQGHGFPGEISRNMDRDEIKALVDAAHARGAKVRTHVADKPMILECLELGVDIIDHGDEVDDEVIAIMAAQGTFWVPSLVYSQCFMDLGWGDPATHRYLDSVREMLPRAQAAGVKILIGDDYSGVFRDVLPDDPLDHQVGNYGREFAFYGAIDGLTAEDVLSWGTANAGELLSSAKQKVGVIEAGAAADLIVIDGDPLADLTLLAQPEHALKAVLRDGTFVIDRLPPGSREHRARMRPIAA